MAGFMAGFGKAFANSFENQTDRLETRRRDNFAIAYDKLNEVKSSYKTAEDKWKAALSSGKTIVNSLGLDLPPEASIKAAEFIMAGYSIDDIEEKMKTSTFTSKPQSVETPEAPDVTQQMQDSGLAPLAYPENETPSPSQELSQPQEEVSPALQGVRKIFPNAGLSPEEKARNRVMEQTGTSQEQMDQYNAGFQQPDSGITMTPSAANGIDPLAEFGLDQESGGLIPNKVSAMRITVKQWEKSKDPDLRAKAARFRALEPDIAIAQAETVDPTEKAAILELLKPSATQRATVSENISTARTVAEQGMALDQMVVNTPEILTLVAQGSSIWETVKTEGQALLNLVTDYGSQNLSEAQMMTKIQPEIDRVSQTLGTPELARAYREFTAAKVRYIYAVGKSLGQQGNGFSNADYVNISNSVFTSNEEGAFSANMKRIAKERFEAVDNDIAGLHQLAEIAGVIKYAPELKPLLDPVLMTMEEQLKDNPILEWMNSGDRITTAPTVEEPAEPMPQSAIDAGIDPKTWKYMKPENKALFK